MNIVEFIEEQEYEKYTDTYHKTIINHCLTELHLFYGVNDDEWVFDELEIKFKNNSIPLLELVESIDIGVDQMTNDIQQCLLLDEGMYRYNTRRLFRFRGDIVVNEDLYMGSLLTVIEYFVVTENRKNEWIDIVRLYEKLSTLKLLIKLNVNVIVENCRNVDFSQLDNRNEKYDEQPFNQKRKESVQAHTLTKVQVDESLTVEQCVELIYDDVERDLISMFNKDEFPDHDKDYTIIPKLRLEGGLKKSTTFTSIKSFLPLIYRPVKPVLP
jgi:hypothetical protein